MKKFLTALLLLIICESAFAEYVMIVPVNGSALSSAQSEIVTLSELYGVSSTIQFWSDDSSALSKAMRATNINPSDSLTLTADVLPENRMMGFYIGAAKQKDDSNVYQTLANVPTTLSFADLSVDYKAISAKAKSEAGSNIALAALIESQLGATSDSELLSLDSDLELENTLLADDRTSSIMDALLPSSGSSDYDLPMSSDNILISGLGGAILGGGGGSGDGFALAAGGSSVPEPSTWLMLILGASGLAVYRKRFAK